MFKKTKLSTGLMLAFGGSLALSGLPALAQETTPAKLDRVEITGSSIKRIEGEGVLPVQTFTQQDIERTGATSVTQFLQSLPVMQGFTSIGDSVGGGGGGITTASIHDVGEQYTLVLLNGRRVAPADSGPTSHLNSIPLAAIARIEGLTAGASAIYGADAIAGVVNFILRSGAAPLKFDARYSAPQEGGGEQFNFAVSGGRGDLDRDGYTFFLAGSYDKTKQLASKDREFAKTGIITGSQGNQNFDFFNGSSRSVPPNVDVFAGSTRLTSFNPYREASGTCPADHVDYGQCYFDYTTTVEIAPEVERMALYGTGSVKLGQSGWRAFADLAYTDVSTIARIAPYPAEFLMLPSHPYWATYIEPYLTPAQAASATDANIKYRLYDMGNRTYEYNTKATHAVGGVEGQAWGWDMTAALTYSVQNQDQNYLKGFPLADKFNAALDAQLFDPFPYPLGTMPADQLAALNATQYTGNYNSTDIDMIRVDANAQRDLFKMGGGSSILSMGMDWTQSGYKQTPNSAVANAEILFDDPQPSFDLSRKGWGAFGEVLFPFSKTIEVTAALRYDSMGGVTDEASGIEYGETQSQTTYKISGKWNPIQSLLLRASYGTGFRTATMLQIARPKTDFGVTSGSYDCPFNAGYDPLGYIAAGYICDNLQKEVFQGGNPQLEPETSKQWNIGGVWQATQNFSVGLNLWSVEIEDAISSVSEDLILSNPDKYLDLYTTKFKSSNGKTYVAILDAPTNIAQVKNQGIDWDFTYRSPTPIGKFTGVLAGTYLMKSEYTLPGTDDQWTTSLGKFGVNDAVSFRNRIRGQATLQTGAWENTLAADYKSGYTDQAYSAGDCVFLDATGNCTAGALDVRSHTTWDWQVRWAPAKNWSLTGGIQNLFDKQPPLSLRSSGAGHQLGYDPRYASPYGRTFYLAGSFAF